MGFCWTDSKAEGEAGSATAGEPEEATDGGALEYTPKPQLIGNLQDEELLPPETVLSGLGGEFKAEEPDEAAGESAGEEGSGEQGKEEGQPAEGDEDGKEEEAEEEEEAKPAIELKTAAYDARFPSTNQVQGHSPSCAACWWGLITVKLVYFMASHVACRHSCTRLWMQSMVQIVMLWLSSTGAMPWYV